MTVPYYISENKSDMRGIKHGRYAIEDDGNLSDRRGTRVGSRLRRPAYVLPAVIFEFFGSVNWTGKSERRAECLYLQPLHPSSSANILSQPTDRGASSARRVGALEPSIRTRCPYSKL